MRIGTWTYLKWKHIIPIKIDDILVAAKIVVYAGETEQYYSIITTEDYKALKEWMDFRSSYGEKITGDL
jgi:hypothetical protein